jgi:pimeloyl-ACP methyl ester carboxylesterase
MLFEDPDFESWGRRALFHASFGGAEFGEVLATATAITERDKESWEHAWTATAERVLAEGEQSAAAGRWTSASDAFLRASNYFRTATPFLYGAPVCDELRELSGRSNAAFGRAMEVGAFQAELLEIPFEDVTLPGWLIRADPEETRPLLICTNGYDALLGEMWFGYGLGAVRRGYHALLFDGPGQGAALMEAEQFLRPDWETVVKAVVDYALTRVGIDEQKIALEGWSLGGYLSLRAASGEPRIKAVIADPGLRAILEPMAGALEAFGLSSEQVENLHQVDDATLEPIVAKALQVPGTGWSLQQRGPMVHGTDSAASYLRALPPFTLSGRVSSIKCPVFLTAAESDPLSGTAVSLYDELQDRKCLTLFTDAEAAGGHCEGQLRNRFQQLSFDWLEEVFA